MLIFSKSPGDCWCKVMLTWNKMQLETTDFAPGAATWRSGRNIRVTVMVILACTIHCMKTRRHTKPEAHNLLHCRNMYENLIKFRRVISEICDRTDKHTDKQTHTCLIAIFRTLIGGDVMSFFEISNHQVSINEGDDDRLPCLLCDRSCVVSSTVNNCHRELSRQRSNRTLLQV